MMMMNELNNSNVRTLSQLRLERIRLRNEINEKEASLTVYFKDVQNLIQPVQQVLYLFKGPKSSGNSGKGVMRTLLKIAGPLIAGRQVLKHEKQFIVMPLLGYLVKKGVSYITSGKRRQHGGELQFHVEEQETGDVH